MEDILILTIGIKGENIMGNPLLVANGLAVIKGKLRNISIETPITSIPDFIKAFENLFSEKE